MSAFHVYNKECSDFFSHSDATFKPASLLPISPEDAEVAAILSNVAQPGEYTSVKTITATINKKYIFLSNLYIAMWLPR